MPRARCAATCWLGVKVDGGVGGSAAGKGMMSAHISFDRLLGESTLLGPRPQVKAGPLTGRERYDRGEGRVHGSLIYCGRRPVCKTSPIGIVPVTHIGARHVDDETTQGSGVSAWVSVGGRGGGPVL